jgi:hypothetical protein
MSLLRTRSARGAAALAVVAVLAAGCGTVGQVTDSVDKAANTVEVCAGATQKLVETSNAVSTAVANYRVTNTAEVQKTIATEFESLHTSLGALIEKAADTDVKAALEAVDAEATRWAAHPETFLSGGTAKVKELTSRLGNACRGA